jgi:hypothetical protein
MQPSRGDDVMWVTAFDALYRWYRNLDAPESNIPPVLVLELRRAYRTTTLGDGTVIRRGDCIGMLHLNHRRVAALHRRVLTPIALGLVFRRDMLASLQSLALLAGPGGRLEGVRAFTAVTIFHHGLPRLGFEADARGLRWPRLTGAYQRALLATLHPDGPSRTTGLASARAARFWLSRERLIARYALPTSRAG